MVELYRNPSGEVNLSTVPQASSGGNRKNEIIITTNDSGASSEDNAKIAKLRATIESLKTQIKAVSLRLTLQYLCMSMCNNCVYIL